MQFNKPHWHLNSFMHPQGVTSINCRVLHHFYSLCYSQTQNTRTVNISQIFHFCFQFKNRLTAFSRLGKLFQSTHALNNAEFAFTVYFAAGAPRKGLFRILHVMLLKTNTTTSFFDEWKFYCYPEEVHRSFSCCYTPALVLCGLSNCGLALYRT